MRYDYTIFHTPGAKMFLADALSRPCDGPTVHSANDPFQEHVLNTGICGNELLSAVTSDDTAQQCIDFVLDGWPSSKIELCGELSTLYHNRNKLTMYNGFLIFGTRFYILVCLYVVHIWNVCTVDIRV